MSVFARCLIVLTLLSWVSSSVAGVLDIDFDTTVGGGPSPTQEGFIHMDVGFPTDSVAVGGVTFETKANFDPMAKYYEDPLPDPMFQREHVGYGSYWGGDTHGDLFRDGVVVHDSQYEAASGKAYSMDFAIRGLTPGVLYDVELYIPWYWFGRLEGLDAGEWRESINGFIARMEPDATGAIHGHMYQVGNTPSTLSGLSVRLVVPELSSVSLLGLAGLAIATRAR